MTFATGCASLDRLLGGGFPPGSISTIHGHMGAGKTKICTHVALNAALAGTSVYYFDPENIVASWIPRLVPQGGPQLSSGQLKIGIDLPLDVALQAALDHLQQDNALVILDNPRLFPTATSRPGARSSFASTARHFTTWLPRVTTILSSRKNSSVLIGEQSPRTGPSGSGLATGFSSAVILDLVQDQPGQVTATLKKHKRLDRTGSCNLSFNEFTIEDKGGLEFLDRRKIPTRFQRKI